MWFGFGLIFLSYEIALVIFAERDIKFAIRVALSLSSLCVSQTKKKHFTAISTKIIEMAIKMFLFTKSMEK